MKKILLLLFALYIIIPTYSISIIDNDKYRVLYKNAIQANEAFYRSNKLVKGWINYCDSIMVSFNGFSNATYSTIMGLDIELTKEFCKHIKQCGKINLGLKLLNSPLTIAETPEFLNWALSLDAKCICIQLAYTGYSMSHVHPLTPTVALLLGR